MHINTYLYTVLHFQPYCKPTQWNYANGCHMLFSCVCVQGRRLISSEKENVSLSQPLCLHTVTMSCCFCCSGFPFVCGFFWLFDLVQLVFFFALLTFNRFPPLFFSFSAIFIFLHLFVFPSPLGLDIHQAFCRKWLSEACGYSFIVMLTLW